ncbi:Phosphofurin acidic cluster sorting protein 2 [Trichinella pseudospiralis]|uniref:Phosphofurin acidic cluster sorting protein 2 n=1 Tax=Trichinella pseudospiralis TaxID=6337 RepID=A0A0V0YE71_TRIPS|nr:Phosphofurin acidic cluster sorting protein 2 [Trichinella pseudospiralis]
MNIFFCSGSLAILQFTNMEKGRVVPMRLFATWEIDRACSSSVPRLCCIVLNRLTILRPFEQELSYLVIAVKLQASDCSNINEFSGFITR